MQVGKARVAGGAFATVDIADVWREGLKAAPDGLADAAQSHDAYPFSGEFATQGKAASGPAAGAQKSVGLDQFAQQCQSQPKGQVGHVVGQDIGGVGDTVALASGRIEVYFFVTHAEDGDDFQRGQAGGVARRNTEVPAGDDGAALG